MKTNTIHVILSGIFLGVIALIATSKSAVNFSAFTTGIGYAAAAIIVALAAVDSRRGTKSYSAR